MGLYASHCVFPVENIKNTAEFYNNKLGFRRVDYLEAKEPHICLYRDGVEVILLQAKNGQKVIPNRELYGDGSDAYFITDDQQTLQEEFEVAGVNIVSKLHLTDYQNLEFTIEDIDGRYIDFGMKQWKIAEDKIWDELYTRAKALIHDRMLTQLMQAGGVAAALMTDKGNIYTGVCIDTASTLGMCAERNAMANMITNGEHNIKKIIAVMGNGKAGPPCGACREFMMQLHPESKNIEIMTDYEKKTIVKLGELMPLWWGEDLV